MSPQSINLERQKTVRLLVCGIVAGPLFVALWLIQTLTRDGFDPNYHPVSLLSLGSVGWIQIVNFVATGALLVACAVGRGWVAASVVAPIAVLVVEAWPDLDTLALRLMIGSAISFGFVAVLAAALARGVGVTASSSQAVAESVG